MNERKYKILNNRLVKKSDEQPIPDDEPVFIFRAQDRKALTPLVAYGVILNKLQAKKSLTEAVNDFRRFQELHPDRMKEPD